MNKNPLIFLAAAGFLATPAVLAQAAVAPVSAGIPSDTLAATVNGDRITMADLNARLGNVTKDEPSLTTGDPAANEALGRIRTQILNGIIEYRLLVQEARRRGIKADPATVNATLSGLEEKAGSEAAFAAQLKSVNKTVADVRQALVDDLEIRELAKELSADIMVGNDDIAAFYKAHPEEFAIPAGIKAHHILVAVKPDASEAEKKKAYKRCAELLRELQNGADFATVARANSDDPSAKENGGDLGAFAKGTMIQSFEDAAFAAPVGRLVGPVLTEFGYHIIRVDEKLPAGVVPLDTLEADPTFKARLLKEKIQKRLDVEVAKLRASGNVQVFLPK